MNADFENDSDTDDDTKVQLSQRFEIRRLNRTLRDYRHRIHNLEESLNRKDEFIQDLKRDKETLEKKLKRRERSRKKVEEQLMDERNHYLVKTERFCREMQESKLERARLLAGVPTTVPTMGVSFSKDLAILSTQTTIHNAIFSEITALRSENGQLREIVGRSDEQNYELCVRYKRLKRSKDLIWKRLQELNEDFNQVLLSVMKNVDDMREEYNTMIDKTFNRSLNPHNEKYMEMFQHNSKLIYENMYSKLELQCLKKDIDRGLYDPRMFRKSKKEKKQKQPKDQCDVDNKPLDIQQKDEDICNITLSGLDVRLDVSSSEHASRLRSALPSISRSFSSPSLNTTSRKPQ